MSNGRRVAAVAIGVLLTGIAAQGAEWLTDLEAAKKAAAEKKVPILVDFTGSDWCGWCIRLDKEVFSQKEFKDFAKDNLVLMVADFPRSKDLPDKLRQQNKEMAAQYKIEGFPTVLLLDATGKQVGQTGYRRGGAEKYVAYLRELIKEAGYGKAPEAIAPAAM